MKRTAGAMVLLTALGGCVSTGGGGFPGAMGGGGGGGGDTAPWVQSGPGGRTIAGMQGPWGQPVAVAAPYNSDPNLPSGAAAARAMVANSVPLGMVQPVGYNPAGAPPGAVVPAGGITPVGMPAMPGGPVPGGVPALGAVGLPGGGPGGGPGGPGGGGQVSARSEVRFTGPTDMKISWYAPQAGGKNGFTTTPLQVPGRYNFVQGAIYRLKLSDIPGRANTELYPTLEVVPANKKTEAFLAHSSVPVTFTEEDFEQVAAGNYLVKVIYLPDPQFQDLAATGPDEVVSTRLEPGVDPIAEACRRGSILLVVRLGNIDLELNNSPAMNAPSPYNCPPKMAGGPGMPGPGMPGMPGMPMVPPGMAMGPNGPMMMPPGMVMGPNGPVMLPPGMPNGPVPPGPGRVPALPTSLPGQSK